MWIQNFTFDCVLGKLLGFQEDNGKSLVRLLVIRHREKYNCEVARKTASNNSE